MYPRALPGSPFGFGIRRVFEDREDDLLVGTGDERDGEVWPLAGRDLARRRADTNRNRGDRQ